MKEATAKLLEVASKKTPPAEPAKAAEPTPAAEAKPAAEPAAATPEKVEPAAEKAEAPDPQAEAPEVDPEAPETPAAPATKEDDDSEDLDPGEVTPISGDRARVRLKTEDELGRMVLAYMKRNKDMTMEQAYEAARTKLGLNKPAADAAKPADPKASLPTSVEDTNAQISKLVAAKKEAATALDVTKMAELDEQIDALREHRSDLRENQTKNQQQEVVKYQEAFAKSEALAVETYLFASRPTSIAGKRMVEIEETWEKAGDARYYSPNKPMLIANLVAEEMKIAPISKLKGKEAPAKAAPAAPAPAAAKKGIIPSGDSKTAPAAPAVNADAERISKITTPAELKAEYKRLGMAV